MGWTVSTLLVLLSLALSGVVGCSGPESRDDAAKEIVVLSGVDVNTLDPYQMTTLSPEENIAHHIWDQLVWRNAESELEPMLAVSWELLDDLTWEFKLREDVNFHNRTQAVTRARSLGLLTST